VTGKISPYIQISPLLPTKHKHSLGYFIGEKCIYEGVVGLLHTLRHAFFHIC